MPEDNEDHAPRFFTEQDEPPFHNRLCGFELRPFVFPLANQADVTQAGDDAADAREAELATIDVKS
jgi:hypothetical protein